MLSSKEDTLPSYPCLRAAQAKGQKEIRWLASFQGYGLHKCLLLVTYYALVTGTCNW